jgi:ATP-binding protein involved in chromosome partitioning
MFGSGGGAEIAREFELELLGMIDLHPDIPKESDEGRPFVVTHPDHEISETFKRVARVLAGKISVLDFSR